MKFYLSIILLTLTFFLNINAQDSEEISQLTPIRKPTKTELKKNEKLSNKSYDPYIGEIIDVSLEVEPKILSNGKRVSAIKAGFSTNSLLFKKTENGELNASLNIFLKIFSNDKKINGTFEETVNFSITKEQLDKSKSLFHWQQFELPEGKYSLILFVRDSQIGVVGYKNLKFEVN